MQSGCNNIVDCRINRKRACKNVVIEYLGIQSQYLRYALIGCKLHGIDVATRDEDYFRAWSIRGTIHIHHINDYKLVISRDVISTYMKQYWNDEAIIDNKKKEKYIALLIDALKDGKKKKNEIIDICEKEGMSKEEKSYLFNPWGGIIRYLIETGRIIMLCNKDNTIALSPQQDLFRHCEVEAFQLERYIRGYSPCTLEDIMYFFKWSRTKSINALENLPARVKKLIRIETYKETKYIMLDDIDYRNCDKIIDQNPFVLSAFDPLLVGYEKKSNAIIPDNRIRNIFTLQGMIFPVIILGHKCVGTWRLNGEKINICLFTDLKKSVIDKVVKTICNTIEKSKVLYTISY